MRNLIVYYSWTGNTEVVAGVIHSLVSGDLKKIEEVKMRKGGLGFAGAAFSALFGFKSKLKPTDINMDDYDTIYLGTPVWASRSTPAINSFIDMYNFRDKKVYLFLTLADGRIPQKCIDSMTSRIEKRGGKVVSSIYIRTTMGSVISPESVKKTVSDWLKK